MAKKEKIPDNNQLYEQLKGLRDKLSPKDATQNNVKQKSESYSKDSIIHTPTGYIHPKRQNFVNKNKRQKYKPKEKIDFYSNEGPIVTRTFREEKKEVITQVSRITPLNQESIKVEISKFPNPPIKFSWVKNERNFNYKFDFSLGEKFQPSAQSDKEDRDMTIGMDFGTSSTKITIRDIQGNSSFAIPFSDSKDIHAYLLPTKIFFDNDKFSLKNEGIECTNLKIKVLTDEANDFDIFAVISYMSLVIRHARSHFFKNYDKNYKGQRFLWRLNVGIPARTVQKFEIKDRYIRLSRAAIICSYGKNDFISIDEAKKAFALSDQNQIINEFKKLPDQIKISFDNNSSNFLEEGVGLYPEIMAQIHGYVHSNEWNQQSNPHILMIDVGAGTLDLSLCGVRQDDQYEFNYYPLACLVEGLGVSNLVRHRENFMLDSTNDMKREHQDLILETLSCLDHINYGEIDVPSSFEKMLEGFEFTNKQTNEYIDKSFKRRIQSAIWSQTVLKASEGSIPGDTTWKPLPVFICGGGSRMPFYNILISEYEKVTDTKVRFSIRKVPQPSDLYNFEEKNDYDRLSVAYGLGFWNLGNFISSFEKPKINIEGEDSPKWSDNFISKDMT